MAHVITVFPKAHINKDGSESKSKKDWFFRDRNRGGVFVSDPYPSKKAAEDASLEYREDKRREHMEKHPNDLNFKRKVQGG